MRLLALGFAAALSAGIAHADVRPEPPLVSAARGPRQHRTIEWKTIASLGSSNWTAIWDRDTEVPLRLWGSSSPIAGTVADPAIAEAAARAFLVAHLDVLAPGAASSDFVLVSNELSPDGTIRSVGFVQRSGGLRVLDGAVGFAFKADRLTLVSSTALPHVSVPAMTQRLSATRVIGSAQRWLRDAGHVVTSAQIGGEPVIVAIVRPRVGARPDIQYRVAEQVDVEATNNGAWQVWVDATSGAPIARKNLISYASGTLKYNVPDRYPTGPRSDKPAAYAGITIDGTAATTMLDGSVTWNGNGAATVRASGPLVSVTSAAGAAITGTLQLVSGGSATWSQASSETGDAQLSAFVHANIVKRFAKTRINPSLAWLDQTLPVSVNESGGCNAFSNGDDIHFLRKNGQCENTGRLADVVYHEFGHSLHAHSIIEGVGAWDSALSEGLSDVLAMLITHDHGMGRGFYLANPSAAMRELDPPDKEKKWGVDTTGEPHDDGEIIGGTFWDLLVALEAQMGQSAGFDQTIRIFYTVMQRSSDIPSSYAEALLGDDDDGDLANGTPHQCAVHAAFAAHGLTSGTPPMGTVDRPVRNNFDISVKAQTAGDMGACPGPSVTGGEITWRLRGGSDAAVAMTASNDQFVGAIPSQPNGSLVEYKVTLTLSTGKQVTYPNNPADPYYEWYVGPVTPIWCGDFEAGAGDWTLSPDWEAGPPMGLGGDPRAATGGANVLGLDLSNDGVYSASTTSSFAESPEIDLAGKTGVRLQMQRWLGVEDGFYDHAKLLINGDEVWTNYASATEPQQSGVNHIDREWRFADFELGAQEASGKVKLRFELTSDEGLQFGGWTLDDVCLVTAAQGPGDSFCGNGVMDTNEACDDGNVTDGDGCSSMCASESGDDGDGAGEEPGANAGCCSVGDDGRGVLALSLITLGLVLRRRRR